MWGHEAKADSILCIPSFTSCGTCRASHRSFLILHFLVHIGRSCCSRVCSCCHLGLQAQHFVLKEGCESFNTAAVLGFGNSIQTWQGKTRVTGKQRHMSHGGASIPPQVSYCIYIRRQAPEASKATVTGTAQRQLHYSARPSRR